MGKNKQPCRASWSSQSLAVLQTPATMRRRKQRVPKASSRKTVALSTSGQSESVSLPCSTVTCPSLTKSTTPTPHALPTRVLAFWPEDLKFRTATSNTLFGRSGSRQTAWISYTACWSTILEVASRYRVRCSVFVPWTENGPSRGYATSVVSQRIARGCFGAERFHRARRCHASRSRQRKTKRFYCPEVPVLRISVHKMISLIRTSVNKSIFVCTYTA